MSTPRVRKDWQIAPYNRLGAKALAEAVGVPPLVAHLLLQRGISSPELASKFLKPSLSHLCDPFSLSGMAEAVARITQARDQGESVLVFGDYDVDGIAASAILLNGLQRFGVVRTAYGMPRRLTEGYGITEEHVEAAARDGHSLIITVDNGISAHDAARRAATLGIGLIVTDHHAIEGGLPLASAVINPKREPAHHPAAQICGAGVAFKLCCALNGTPNDLDIAALGTVADIVPLVGENRVIVAMGLRHMARHRRVGIAKLAEAAGVKLEEISAEKIGFQLGPRINAAGRLDDGLVALRLLLSECEQETENIARSLNAANDERRGIERVIFDEACDELDAFFTPDLRSIVLGRRGWHSGVIGIVASRLFARYHRPVVLVAIDDDGVGRGSARSGEGFDLVGALSTCQGLLERFGGHKSAAGFTILEENLSAFRELFELEARRQFGVADIRPRLNIDALVAFSEIDSGLIKSLEMLEPLGHANPSPLFAAAGVRVAPGSVRVLKDEHLKFTLLQEERAISAIAFGMAEQYHTEGVPEQVDVAFVPQLNTWRGETTVQLQVKDLRPAESVAAAGTGGVLP